MNADAADLLERTRRAWEGLPAPPRILAAAQPGDVFVLEKLAEFDLEWVVLERQPSTGRLLVVAADGQPLVGSSDVEVAASQPGGPLVLRCRFGAWVDTGALGTMRRTGALDADVLARARERRAMIESGQTSAGSVLALEVDDETPYVDWVKETLEPARSALTRLSPAEPKPQAPRPRRFPAGRLRYGQRALALAATFLLALAAAILWRQHQEVLEVRDAGERYRREVDDLRQEQERLTSVYRQELDEAQARGEQLETESRRRLDELGRQLEALSEQATVVNPVVESLEPPRGRRGPPKSLRLDDGASHLLLAVALEGAGERYRAELLDRATGKLVWEQSGLQRQPLGLWIGLPAALIPPGEYLLRIFELTRESSEPAAEYPLNVAHEGRPSGSR